MITSFSSNWRAAFYPVAVLGTLLVLIAPAAASVGLADSLSVNENGFGTSLSEIEDLNGDGTWELLVGQPGFPSGNNAGRVSLWWGGTDVSEHGNVNWTGVVPELFGWSVARIGDVDNDGNPDWAVGAPGSNEAGTEAGKVYVFYGDPDPANITSDEILGEIGGGQFGFSVSAAGDFNHDGKDDFIVGAPFAASNRGAAYIIYGKNGGVSTNLADALRLVGENGTDRFGWSVSDAGNFLGGSDDHCVAVGAPFNSSNWGLNSGAVYVYEGSSTPNDIANHVIGISGGNPANSNFGFSVKNVGNWGGSSLDDLAIGGPFNNNAGGSAAGRVDIVYGDVNPSASGDKSVQGQAANDQFGFSVARVYDVIGGGADDVLIGAPYHNAGGSDTGRAYLYAGGSNATSAGSLDIIDNEPIASGTQPDDWFGFGVASAGDFDNDGLWDYAVGAPNGNTKDISTAGFVRLYDSSDMAVPSFLDHWRAKWAASHEPGLVSLDFAFASPAASYLRVDLTRRVLDRSGRVATETALWSGPAVYAAEGEAGILALAGSAFRYLDVGPDRPMASDQRLSYDVTVFDEEGRAQTLTSLAGPAGAPGTSFDALLALDPAWPNPANPSVTVRFRASPREMVHLRILDVRGRLVQDLFQGPGTGAWQHEVWNGKTRSGQAAASGLYLIHLENGDKSLSQRVVLAR